MLTKKLKLLVKSGAIHPLALVQEALTKSATEHPLWHDTDFNKFPWPQARTLFDLTAHVCQKFFLPLNISEKQYYRLLAQVELSLFGCTNPERILS